MVFCNETLEDMNQDLDSSCTKEVFKRVPNLNKLGILNDSYDTISLDILVNLPQLETLKISSLRERVRVPVNFTFPTNIKKLTLGNCKIAWKHMTIVGSMPNLEVLKLLDGDKERPGWEPEWEPTEGEFCKLKFLLLRTMFLVQWRASNTNFKSLECLMLKQCSKLEEIPHSIGDIPTLQIIELDDASPSAVISAKQIQEDQENLGNDILQVHVLCEGQFNHQQSEELEAKLIANLESNDDKLQISACSQLTNLINGINALSKGLISRIFSRLLKFLDRDDFPQLQVAAAGAIGDILFCSSHTFNITVNILIEQGAVPIMVSLLSSAEDELRGMVGVVYLSQNVRCQSNM
ncbi:putative late blight resistance protein homolog R1B-16 [Olea europaea var. sylvestris]|uniref:putative late blight resistance protein homolog R1B-16 n=1 Tax=Olea europaea var. sylvestris TaxID=158386 RepID=UPI000C1D5F3D|nr:putative late blight resistance protein homolog R1B-16 [Olea europaea var. sylvestris]